MVWHLTGTVEEALWATVRERLPEAAVARKRLLAAIGRRSDLYTREREALVAARADPADLAARALFFTPADAAKIKVPLAELAGAGRMPEREPLRLLDVGAGCGAMTLGAIEALAARRLEILAVDSDAEALAILGDVVGRLDADVDLRVTASDLRRWKPRGQWDLIAAGSVFNELGEAEADRLARSLIEALAPDGALIAIEPALREVSRRLHRLRDRLLAAGIGFVFAPCTRTAASCPALDDERDWCHEDRPFEPPRRLGALTRATGMRQRRLKFAYLVVRREPGTVAGERAALRVVSRPRKLKGATELFACSDAGRCRLRLQKRDRTPDNRALERARRGDLLVGDPSRWDVIDPTRT